MDQDTAHYIVTYFFVLMPENEKIAWKHYSSILKLEGSNNPKMLDAYKRKGWITEDREILDLLEKGYEDFEIKTAKKILENFPQKIIFNNCPKCNKLARTPYAKVCRFCGFNWHNSNSI